MHPEVDTAAGAPPTIRISRDLHNDLLATTEMLRGAVVSQTNTLKKGSVFEGIIRHIEQASSHPNAPILGPEIPAFITLCNAYEVCNRITNYNAETYNAQHPLVQDIITLLNLGNDRSISMVGSGRTDEDCLRTQNSSLEALVNTHHEELLRVAREAIRLSNPPLGNEQALDLRETLRTLECALGSARRR